MIGGEFHVNDSACRVGVAVGGSIAIVAIQQIMGLLPKRRSGTGCNNRFGPTADGPIVKSNGYGLDVDGGSASSHHLVLAPAYRTSLSQLAIR